MLLLLLVSSLLRRAVVAEVKLSTKVCRVAWSVVDGLWRRFRRIKVPPLVSGDRVFEGRVKNFSCLDSLGSYSLL
uniref:Putative secreted protein n=1 Tax=Anopheles marajoara TaxID=58244 RepID=A0A2M4CD17_9DIPT